MKRIAPVLAPLVFAAAVAGACTPSDFYPSTRLESVRVLATRADGDASYAKPGDVVTLETLAVDARPHKAEPMVTYWIPYVCQDPAGDSYVGCFTPSATGDAGVTGAGEAGAGAPAGGGSLGGLLQPGTDVTPYLPTGPTYTFTVPSDIAIKHVEGAPFDYGLVIVFNVVCAGRVHIKPFDPSTGPQQVPLGCFDSAGNELTPNDYVIGFTRVYVYSADTFASEPRVLNHNPDVIGVVADGVETKATGANDHTPVPIDLTLPACHGHCEPTKIDVDVPDTSWEANPNDKDENGNVRHESIWVDYYAAGGNVDGEARLLYDATLGRLSGTEVKYSPPDDPGDGTLYAVVHDDRDGITWLSVHVHAQ